MLSVITDCHVHVPAAADYHAAALRLLKQMQKHGISRMLLSDLGDGWKAFPDSQTVYRANKRLRELCAGFPGTLYYLVYLNPQLHDWQEEFNRHCSTAAGVKLWISLRSEGDDSLARSADILRTAAQHELPVLIHTFDTTDALRAGSIGIDGIIRLARSVPECSIVAAHACGSWRRAIEHAAEFPENISFDISGGYPERTMLSRLISAFGEKRILYGSDAPGRSFGSQLHKVAEAGLTASALHAVLNGNAERIFKLAPLKSCCWVKNLPCRILADLSEDHFCFAGKSPWFDHNVTTAELAEAALRSGVKKAFAASLEAVSTSDKLSANARWLAETASYPVIAPLASVDLRNMPQALLQLEKINGFAGIWLSPYLHSYRLDAAEFSVFFDRCYERRIPVWINAALSDDRFRWKKLSTRPLPLQEIIAFAVQAPRNHYIVQGAVNHQQLSQCLPENVHLEYSRLSDGEYLAEDFTGNCSRLCRGSEYPFRDYTAVDDVLLGKI